MGSLSHTHTLLRNPGPYGPGFKAGRCCGSVGSLLENKGSSVSVRGLDFAISLSDFSVGATATGGFHPALRNAAALP